MSNKTAHEKTRDRGSSALKRTAARFVHSVGHTAGRLTNKYYFEDYMRVYPDDVFFDAIGRRRHATKDDVKNYLNHLKFYRFAAQFVEGKSVVDVGCGSGYGCRVLKEEGGASTVDGCDLSSHALKYAKDHFGRFATFSRQGVTNLSRYQSKTFDVSISSEVIEHVKEYRMEREALSELRRITREGGLVILATPNAELLPGHGFTFDELDALVRPEFDQVCIFENALVPFTSEATAKWKSRLATGRVGVTVSEKIELDETVLPPDGVARLKEGIPAGRFSFAGIDVNTSLLHNTHSWVVLAQNGARC